MSTKIFSIVIATIALTSCSGGNSSDSSNGVTAQEETIQELIIKPAQTVIKGDLKGCYEVVDKNYKVKFAKKSYENDNVTIELKRTSQELPYDRKNVVIFPEAKESTAEFCAGFGIEILDENGDVLDKINAQATPYSWDEMTTALQLLEDETTTIVFYFEDLSKATSFRITSIVQPNEERKNALSGLVDAAQKASELSKGTDSEDVEKALKVADEAIEAAGKMIDIMGDLK